jgi:hypothetical protein
MSGVAISFLAFKKAQAFANDFAGRLIPARRDARLNKSLQFGSQ